MAAFVCALVVFAGAAMAQDYDIVIKNGRVMDPETLYDGVANVGIKGGRIVKITKKAIDGKKIVDATDHVVAPGFIDTHYHWQRTLGYMRKGTSSREVFEAQKVAARWARAYQVT